MGAKPGCHEWAQPHFKERRPDITQGIKQVLEHAAIQAIRNGDERISLGSLSSWRTAFDAKIWWRSPPERVQTR
jgi:hypothetical protein